MTGIKDFAEWLASRSLSLKTIKQYLIYYKALEREVGDHLNQQEINNFVIRHTSNITRSFLKNLFEFYKLKDFEVPKSKGRKAKKKRVSISPQEMKGLRQWMYGHQNYKFGLMLDLSYFCGLRREEVTKVALNDFELKKWSENTFKPCRLKIHGKGSKERIVVVPPKLMMRILKWIKTKKNISSRERLFGVKEFRWHEIFKKAVRSSGLSHDFSLHDLRRTRGTKWIGDLGLNKARIRLGHSAVSTTQLYFNEDEEKELSDWEKEF